MKRGPIIYLYNQLEDPVIQSNIFLYIKSLATDQTIPHHFAIVTYESSETLSEKEKIINKKAELARMNISWHPLQWHQGTSLHLKLIDFLAGFFKVATLRMSGYRHIVTLASVAGSYAYLFSLVLRLRLYLYQYEPHSEYEVDQGTYTRESLTFKILNVLERRSAFFATVISSGTRHMMDRLKGWNVKAQLFRIPSVVNDQKFIFSDDDRRSIRAKYGIGLDKIVMYYPGKFGGLYYKNETIELFAVLLALDANFHALVVTPNDINEITQLFLDLNVSRDRFTVTRSTFDNIQKYNSAADFAIIAAPPGPSKKFVSNIKVGEYLCSGLPYIISRGISEDDEYAIRYKVGVVIKEFNKEEITGAYQHIMQILSAPASERRAHCRAIGIDYRGFSKLNIEFRKAIKALQEFQR
jgi:hypothetical protein